MDVPEVRELLLKTALSELRSTLTPHGVVRLAGPIEAAEGAFGHATEEVLGVLFRGVAHEYDTMIRQARQGPRAARMRVVRSVLERAVISAACWRNKEAQMRSSCDLAQAMVAAGMANGVPEVVLLAEVNDDLSGESLFDAVHEMLAAAAALRRTEPRV
jgi:uncharacterized membrane protein